jgi:hypothetical protein
MNLKQFKKRVKELRLCETNLMRLTYLCLKPYSYINKEIFVFNSARDRNKTLGKHRSNPHGGVHYSTNSRYYDYQGIVAGNEIRLSNRTNELVKRGVIKIIKREPFVDMSSPRTRKEFSMPRVKRRIII